MLPTTTTFKSTSTAEEQSYFPFRPASYSSTYTNLLHWSYTPATTFYKFPHLPCWLKPNILSFAFINYLRPKPLNLVAATTGDANIGNHPDGLEREFENGMEDRYGGALSYYIYSKNRDWSSFWTWRLYTKVEFGKLDKRGGYLGKYWTVRGSASDAESDY